MSRHPLLDARVLTVASPDFPALQADIALDGGALRLIGIHPPPPVNHDLAQGRDRFMRELAVKLDQERAPGRETLVFGDFNSTVWSPRLRDFQARTGLSDAQRGQGAPDRSGLGVGSFAGTDRDRVPVGSRNGRFKNPGRE
jgi:endonuclease/exonuclease/phosphatase (EEP) superfamily protein YafD